MLAMISGVDPEYVKRATPPDRFVEALTGDGHVICLRAGCNLPMVVDPMVFSTTRAMVREWRRNSADPVPLRLLKLIMHCINGHAEVWHAEPVVTREAAQAAAEAEEARYRGPLTAKTCTVCAEEYEGNKYSRYCPDCKVSDQ